MTDKQLWKSIKNGNRAALADLYKSYVKVLFNYGLKICHNNQTVEDSIHDLFVDLWRFRENLSTAQSVKFYLYASLRRKIFKQDSNDHLIINLEFNDMHDSFPSQEAQIIDSEINVAAIKKLQSLLNNLPSRQYEAITLRFFDDMTYEEIGLIMHINPQSVRNHVERGLDQLKRFSKISV